MACRDVEVREGRRGRAKEKGNEDRAGRQKGVSLQVSGHLYRIPSLTSLHKIKEGKRKKHEKKKACACVMVLVSSE